MGPWELGAFVLLNWQYVLSVASLLVTLIFALFHPRC